jgi:heat shock protein HslJ
MSNATGNKRIRLVSVLALMGLLLSACVPITPVPAEEEPAAEATTAPVEEGETLTLEGVNWRLVEYLVGFDALAMAAAEATMTFQDGRVSGNGGCNTFSAGYTVEGQQLTVEPAASTMMACEEPIMGQEQTFFTNLGQAASYEIVDNQLHILDAEGRLLLSFEPQAAAALTGVLWLATNYNNGQQAVVNVLDGTEITAVFGEDGSLSGSAGCNNYVAGYTVEGAQITIGPAAMTRMLCAEPEGVMEQEAAYVAALETAATYSIQGDMLEMRTADDAMVALYRNAGPADAGATDAGVGEEAGADIVGVPWQWVETAYGDETTLSVDEPTNYTMTLLPDGAVNLQVDCNRGGGSYTLDGSLISLDVAVMTRMACPEGTLSDVFIRELNAAATFVMDGEDLVLNLFADAGNMRFVRAQ